MQTPYSCNTSNSGDLCAAAESRPPPAQAAAADTETATLVRPGHRRVRENAVPRPVTLQGVKAAEARNVSNAARRIASIVESSVACVTDREFQDAVVDQLKKTYLLDDGGRWVHEAHRRASDRILPKIDSAIVHRFITEVTTHVEDNAYVMRFLEAAIENNFPTLAAKYQNEGTEVLKEAVAYGIALESLTKAQVEDPEILEACLSIWQAKRKEKRLTPWEMNPFGYAKMVTIEGPVKTLLSFHKSGKVDPTFFMRLLPVNIIEALLADLYKRHPDNARTAWILAKNRPTLRIDSAVGTGPTEWSADKKAVLIKTPLARKWDDLYQTWNMAFVSQFGPVPFFLSKLLIPSVNGYKEQPNAFLYRRIISLYNHLHHFFLGRVYDEEHGIPAVDWRDEKLTKLWGRMNRGFARDYSDQVRAARQG